MLLREKFMVAILYLQKLFGKALSDDVLEIYWNRLKNFTEEQFDRALKTIIDTFIPTSTVPFPMVAHFMQASGMSGESRAQAAVTAIKKAAEKYGAWESVSFGDCSLHATINRFGGWPVMSRWADSNKWDFQEKNFMAAYVAAYESGEYGPEYCPGLFEIDNKTKPTEAFSIEQKEFAEKSFSPHCFRWVGYKGVDRIENKVETLKIAT